MQDNNALYYCEKVFKHKDFGWGVYEGQCDKYGNCLGIGRWLCQDNIRPHWFNLVEEGYFKNDKVEGLAVQSLTNGDRFVAEYKDGNLCGAITAFLGDKTTMYNAICIANNALDFKQSFDGKPEHAWFAKPTEYSESGRSAWLKE